MFVNAFLYNFLFVTEVVLHVTPSLWVRVPRSIAFLVNAFGAWGAIDLSSSRALPPGSLHSYFRRAG
jgi:hypothetical protein